MYLTSPESRSTVRSVGHDPVSLIENMARDPSLRLTENGRRLLRVLHCNAMGEEQWAELIAAVPPHCRALVLELAHRYEQMWTEIALELDARSRASESGA